MKPVESKVFKTPLEGEEQEREMGAGGEKMHQLYYWGSG